MRIQTNVSALNAWRNLNQTSGAMGKNLERLSSGFRINRAADDAAGLAISEKMRAQIRGLNQATRNAQDGISLIQTAEGAMGEIQNILQRMRELADQAASDGLTDNDRGQIQKEVDQLAKQITDVANTTQFNTKRILTGEYGADGAITIQTGANKGEALGFGIAAVDAYSLGVGRAQTVTQGSITDDEDNIIADASTVTVSGLAEGTYTIQVTIVDNGYKVQLRNQSGGSIGSEVDVGGGGGVVTLGDGTQEVTVQLADLSGLEEDNFSATLTVTQAPGDPSTYAPASEANNWQATTYGGINISTQADASQAITDIDKAINDVSGYRAELGALQNRLEHSIANLQITAENLQAAESRIRDVDMAQEMTHFTRSQILMQSGTAMLAQANMMPQAVLKLLG